MFGHSEYKHRLPTVEEALPGRAVPMQLPAIHHVLGHTMSPPFPEGSEQVVFALGCFWGAERKFWEIEGVHVTAAGYIGGLTPNPTYEEVCSGLTGHTEGVLVVYDPRLVKFDFLLKKFWESHDPTQGMRQGNDRGTQYRSAIFCFEAGQQARAEKSKTIYQQELNHAGVGEITTEISGEAPFYYAEGYHQQYLAKNPAGYCGLGGTGVALPVNVDFLPRETY